MGFPNPNCRAFLTVAFEFNRNSFLVFSFSGGHSLRLIASFHPLHHVATVTSPLFFSPSPSIFALPRSPLSPDPGLPCCLELECPLLPFTFACTFVPPSRPCGLLHFYGHRSTPRDDLRVSVSSPFVWYVGANSQHPMEDRSFLVFVGAHRPPGNQEIF